jgi:transcriptional regulator with XRE-family HTH domain
MNRSAFGAQLKVWLDGGGRDEEYPGNTVLSQGNVADYVGKTSPTVSHWVNGRTKPNNEDLAGLVFVLYGYDLKGMRLHKALGPRSRVWRDPTELLDWVELLDYDSANLIAILKRYLPQCNPRTDLVKWLREECIERIPPEVQGVNRSRSYVERSAELTRLRDLLLVDKAYRVPMHRHVCLWGMGGIGKTVMAKAIALDERVQQYFRNGVLWAEIGPRGEPRDWLNRWCELLSLPVRGDESVRELNVRVRKFLSAPGLRFLIVLDDVWQARDVEPLLVGGPQSRVLLTMREKHPAQKLGVDDCFVEVGGMTEEEAGMLIRRRLGERWREEEIELGREMTRMVDCLPLAIQLGATVVKQRGWEYVLSHLRQEGQAIDVLALSKAERREHSLRLTLDLSYENLAQDPRELFERLGMFAPGEIFTVWDLAFGWMEQTLALTVERQIDFLRELLEASLVMEVEAGIRYQMHTVVGHYAAEKLEARVDKTELWRQYIEHALDILTTGVGLPQGIAPRKKAQMLDEHWPHIQRAWRRAQKLWRKPMEDNQQPGERAVRWARAFGSLACQALWRWRDWAGVVRWAAEAREMYRKGYRQAWGEEPDLLCWQIDGLLMQGESENLVPLLEDLRKVDFGTESLVWQMRCRIREARWHILVGEKETAQELMEWIEGEANTLVNRSNVELAYHTLAEVYELMGEYAARWGEDAEAEWHWWTSCRIMIKFLSQGDEFGFDEWRLEQIVERIVRWRAEHGLWGKAALAGRMWVAMRIRLGEEIDESLVDVGTWALKGAETDVLAWAIDGLQMFLDSGEYSHLNGITCTLQGLLLAEQGRGTEAVGFLKRARKMYASDPQGEGTLKFLAEVLEAVQEGEQPSIPLQSPQSAYSIPCGELDSTETFDQWLSETTSGRTRQFVALKQ